MREVFGVDFTKKLTAQDLKTLGDPSFGILFEGENLQRNPQKALEFYALVSQFKKLFSDTADANAIIREVIGVDFTKKLTAQDLKTLGDPSFGILFEGENLQRNPQKA